MQNYGQSRDQLANGQMFVLGSEINHVYDTPATVITRPDGASFLVMKADKGNWRMRPGDTLQKTFTAEADDDTLTITGHGYRTGHGPIRLNNSGGALPTGLSNSTDYYAIVVDANTIKLATSADNAAAGTAVAFTTDGSGTNTIVAQTAGAEFPSADVTNGSGSWLLKEGEEKVLKAPEKVTVVGFGTTPVLTYQWL